MVAFHELDIEVFVLEEIGFEIARNALLGDYFAFNITGLRLNFG